MDLDFNSNDDFNKLALSELRKRLKKVKEGGGAKNLEKLHAQGKLSARERIDYLLDKEAPYIEIGAFAGDGMYPEHGGCPSAGVVVVIGYVEGQQCVIVANDPKSLLKTACPSSTLSIVPAYTCLCKMKYSPTKSISGAFSATMR